MQDKLRAAFSLKERSEIFLTNLEKLREEKSAGDAQYRVLTIEYNQMRQDAISRINTIKTYVKNELAGQQAKLDVLKQELSYLETRFKVGQLLANEYLYKEKGPKRKLAELEKRISGLQVLLNSSSSDELGIAPTEGGLKILGFNLGLSKKQLSEQVPPVSPKKTVTGQVNPPTSVPQPTSAPIPPLPLPPVPVMVNTTGLQIMPERVMEGASVGIIVTVTNITQENVQQKVELKINSEVKDSTRVDLLPGQSQEITFVQVAKKSGSYKVDINGLTSSFSVIPAETIRSLR